jgi:hypothetical protein
MLIISLLCSPSHAKCPLYTALYAWGIWRTTRWEITPLPLSITHFITQNHPSVFLLMFPIAQLFLIPYFFSFLFRIIVFTFTSTIVSSSPFVPSHSLCRSLTPLHTTALYAWGSGQGGRVGVGDQGNHHLPILLSYLHDITIEVISAGAAHSVALSCMTTTSQFLLLFSYSILLSHLLSLNFIINY